MWILFHSEGKSLCLLPGKQYVIGRKSGDLVLDNDHSISRKHAVIIVSSNRDLDISVPPSTLKLVDENSKYGTFILGSGVWKQLSHGEERTLIDKDTIRFGLLENLWRVMYVPLIVTMSNLRNEEKKQLRSNVMNIGGYITKAWSSSLTHLTMNSITLTIKAICTLACGKPIVTPEYWTRYLDMAENNKDLPDHNMFLPPFKEPAIDVNSVCLAVNDARRHVFRGQHFVFASRIDLKELGCMVTAAGGTVAAFDEYNTASLDQLCLPHVVLIAFSFITSSSAPTQQAHLIEPFNNAKGYLESRGRRVVADSEIGYAILYCSTEKYCNPEQHLTDTLFTQAQSSRVSLDFTSQALDKPAQDMESVPLTIVQTTGTNKQPVIQRAGISHNQDSHSEDSTYVGYSVPQSTCASAADIFASPIKIKVEHMSVKGTSESRDSRKRIRTPEPDNTSDFKRPARVSNAPLRIVEIKGECDDAFTFTTPSNTRTRSVNNAGNEDEFTFSGGTKRKLETSMCLNESSDDLFEIQPNDRAQRGQHAVQPIATSTLRTTQPSGASQKRKKPIHESLPPLLKKRALSFNTSLQDTSLVSKTRVSLQGFLDTSSMKSDCQEIDDLADSVKEIFVIEKKLLVIRDKIRVSISINETKNVSLFGTSTNFKRFRKIAPLNQRILPRIIGGQDLYIYKEDVGTDADSTLDESEVDGDLEVEVEKDKRNNKNAWLLPVSKSKRTCVRAESRQ